jgi:hypothetical protein
MTQSNLHSFQVTSLWRCLLVLSPLVWMGCGDSALIVTAPDSGKPDVVFNTDGGGDTNTGLTGLETGEACLADAECLSLLCVPSADGSVCTGECDDACTEMGWDCRMTDQQPPTLICVPPHATLCQPCVQDSDCHVPGIKSGERCLDMGEHGRFCGAECDDDSICPDGYTCTDVGTDDVSALQCWPTSGECSCSAYAIENRLTTICHTSNSIGTCLGERSCGPDGLGACSAPEAETEVCDNVDNDCDGGIDEELVALPCEPGPDYPCGGTSECIDGVSQCSPHEVKAEVCDLVDNDCDGKTDEDFPGVGEPCDGPDEDECANGILSCTADGTGVECLKEAGGPQLETCDGIDNDCDGKTDEDLLNACGGCGPVPVEVCDGEDNDCDGVTDNAPGGCLCVTGQTKTCGSDVGECETATQTCNSGQWSACNDKGPQPETCDGKDNDCDGVNDNSVLNACGTCGAVPVEKCDGVDNDCDGITDNAPGGCTCITGQTKTCGTDLGECASATQTCNSGQWSPCNDKGPQTEICDGKDNNCDGSIDEGVKNDCGTCGAVPVEVCDGYDNDCDGSIDEGVKNDCGTCGAVPVEVCDGYDNDCDGSIDEGVKNDCGTCGASPTEICDGIDNDCDGSIDEGVKNKCGTCGVTPTETCDGIDNDCDGAIDEGVKNKCGKCGAVPDEVCDGVDNDCDGLADEGGVCGPPPPCTIDIKVNCLGSGTWKANYSVMVNNAPNGVVTYQTPDMTEPKKNWCVLSLGNPTPFNLKASSGYIDVSYELGKCAPSGTVGTTCQASQYYNCQ